MLVPNRHGSSNSYRYGFQGQEKDDELKGEGNSLNYTFRMHDPRVGRFFATDPLTRNYPYYSPYSFSGNKVIAFRELEGMEQKYYAIYLNEQNGACVHELKEKEKSSSFFSPDSVTFIVYSDHDGKYIASYTFQKNLPTADPDEAININNPYKRYKEFIEDPIGSMLSGEFKTHGEVLNGLMEDAMFAIVIGKMGNLPKGTFKKSFIPLTGGKYVSPWLRNLRTKVANYVASKVKSIKTPYGEAHQSSSIKAIFARGDVESGAKLYRLGTLDKSHGPEAQFWSLENPISNPQAYAKKYGMPVENVLNADFIEVGTLKPGTNFITRPAPPIPGKSAQGSGGGIEVVVPANGVRLESFHTTKK